MSYESNKKGQFKIENKIFKIKLMGLKKVRVSAKGCAYRLETPHFVSVLRFLSLVSKVGTIFLGICAPRRRELQLALELFSLPSKF